MRTAAAWPLLGAALLALAGCLGSGPGAPQADGATEPFRVVASQELTQEGFGYGPSIEVGADGTIYVAAARGADTRDGAEGIRSSRLWVSRDGGATFQEIMPVDPATGASNLPFGIHGDVAVDLAGNAYFVDLTLAETTLSRSTDGGRTWELRNPAVFAVPWGDREWVAAGPEGMVAVTWVNILPVTTPNPVYRLWVAVSTDGGLTFPVQTAIAETGETSASGIDVAPDGTIIVVRDLGGAVAYVSRDGGATFQQSIAHATENPTDYGFVATAADGAGNLYVAWAEHDGDNTQVRYAASSDHGASWSRPVLVSDLSGSAALPWIDAAGDGHLAVAYYAAPGDPGDPNAVDGPWWPYVTDVADAASDHPVLRTVPMTQAPVHNGTLCNRGFAACGGPAPLGGYLQVAIAPDGSDHVAWSTTGRDVHWGVARLEPSLAGRPA